MNQPVPPLPPARRNPVASFFIGLWDVMNFTRRLILNLVFFGLLFLLLVMFVIAAGMGAGASKSLQDRTTLVIAPEGRLVEQFSADPVSRALAKAVGDNGAEEIQLRDLLRVIESAKEDKKIERVVLELDKLQPSGFASLREVAAALQDLRASGKQLVAYSESMGQSQYLLAAQADEVYLDPMGSVVLEAWAATASTSAPACRTSWAWTCTCSRWASTSPRPSRTCSTPPRRRPRKPTCSG